MKKYLFLILSILLIIPCGVCCVLFASCGVSENSTNQIEENELLEFENIAFTSATFNYDGTLKSVLVSGELPEGAEVVYSNNSGINAGEYNATATITCDGYRTAVLRSKLTINKIDITGIKFEDAKFTYDGAQHKILISGNLPNGASVSYTNNKATNIGKYNASATISGTNYNTLVLNANLIIKPNYLNFAQTVFNKILQLPDFWEYLPDSFSLENKAYTGNTEIDYSSFIPISSIPQTGIGKQMNVVYSTLILAEKPLSYLNDVYAISNTFVNFYQTFLNDDPDDFTSYEKSTANYTFKVLIKDDDYCLFIKYKNASIELVYQQENQKCLGRIQLSDSNVLKYEFSDNDLTFALSIFNVSLTEIHFERNGNVVKGTVCEFYGTESKNIKTSALIEITNNYTSIISNKRETDDLIIEGYLEIYDNASAKLIASEVKETVKSIEYDTLWFNIYDISGLSTIKVVDEINGENSDTIYINNKDEAIHTKLVGITGGLKAASRRFDIEMKDMYFYKYNTEEEKYEKIKIEIPMLFVQKENLNSFSNDFKDKNDVSVNINVSATNLTYLNSQYQKLLEEYAMLKQAKTYQSVKTYIGTKNEYFN